MKIIARKCPNCKDVLYSRAQNDFRTCGCGDTSVDGGPGVKRTLYKKEIPENVELDVNVTKGQLYDDWNNEYNKYGIVKSETTNGNVGMTKETVGKIEQLTETTNNTLQLVDQKGELLFECEIGDEYHQMILEVGLNKILKDAVKQWEKNHFWNINQKLTEFKTEKKKI